MNIVARITYLASALVVAGLIALAAPMVAGALTLASDTRPALSATSAPAEADTPTAEAVASSSPVASNDTDYTTWSEVDLAAAQAEDPHPSIINHPSRFAPGCVQNSEIRSGRLVGAQTIVDTGAREPASGSTVSDASGRIVGYKVDAGDAGAAIGERFCIDYVTVLVHNDSFGPNAIQPGQVLELVPGSLQ